MAARTLAAIALAWIVHRALVQSITLDEAITYLFWVRPEDYSFLKPHSNNHILNSLLMWLADRAFGLSHLALRLPALLGGALYITATYRLSGRLATTPILRAILLACFLFNPFVMDYLVAARGYALALGFLALMLDELAIAIVSPRPNAVYLSLWAALAFSANFSWAYAIAILWCVTMAWLLKTNPRRLQTLTTGILPGAILVAILCGPALLHYPKDQLFWGVQTLSETVGEIRASSFNRPNPDWLPTPALLFFNAIQPYAGWFILAIALAAATVSRSPYAASLALCLLLTTLCHWLQLRLYKIPLPYERTSLFAVPIFTAMLGALIATIPTQHLLRVPLTAALAAVATFFATTLRDSHFNEWAICAETRPAFQILESHCRATGQCEVVSDLNYVYSFNVYRLMYPDTPLKEFSNYERPPSGKPIYVLPRNQYASFIANERLTPIYFGKLSDFTVLVKSGKPPMLNATYFEIPATNLDRAQTFYESIFDCKLERQEIDGNQMALFAATQSTNGIGGALAQGKTYIPSHNGTRVYFTTKSIEATLAKVKAAGGKTLYPKTAIGDLGFVAEFEDSEGNRVALHQP